MLSIPADDFFWRIHDGLPREGPGNDASTRKAFQLIEGLPPRPRILDVGCGPGMQTLELARLSEGLITAVDTHQPFLDELARRSKRAGFAERIRTVNASMDRMPFEPESFDLIWCEGAIYFMGLFEGLAAWQPLLHDPGFVAVTHPCWLKADVPQEARDNWASEGFAMTTIENDMRAVARAGYALLGHFVLPEEAWWDHYYTPMAARLAALRGGATSPNSLQRIAEADAEIDAYRRFPDCYGYVFFVMQKLN